MHEESPLLRQYRSIKAEYPDAILMFRVGDFFEMFERDAETAARELELTLTSKPMGKSGRLPLAGVPHHSVESYIARLVRKGYHIAVCDQTEDARHAKGLVKREVIRVITPGTYSGVGGERSNKFIAALAATDAGLDRTGAPGIIRHSIAICDLLTGEMYVGTCREKSSIEAICARFKPAEIIVPDSLIANDEEMTRFLSGVAPGAFVTRFPDWKFAASYADDLLRAHFRVSSLSGLGLDIAASGPGSESESAAGPAAALLSYLRETQKSSLAHITSISRIDLDETVSLDASTLLQLEIVDSPSRDKETTLLSLLDDAVTAMGSRLIARRITAPLKDVAAIRQRLDVVDAFHGDPIMREDVRTILERVYDLERLAGRISLGTITPREVVGLASSLEAVPDLRKPLSGTALDSAQTLLDAVPDLSSSVRERLVETPPLEIGVSPLFRDGVSLRLDELRHGSRASRQWIAELQALERERTGIASLKVSFNNVFGYFIEITKTHLAKVPEHYRRKQTTSTGERYFTEELKAHEDVVLRANDRITELETTLFGELRTELVAYLARIKATASVVAELDLSAAFAEVAAKRRYCKPDIIESPENSENNAAILRIEDGRHPMVEALLSGEDSFVANSTALEGEDRFMILTGPNMAGKSTYIRQVALIALMAQIGSFVPATKCVLSPFDGIYARIGASDRLARGLSTFMVEMIEAAMILRRATARSLVILDEIGRGTSTYDGLSIAWAIVEALSARGSLSLFATHYHELTALAETVPGVHNTTVAVKEWGDRVHFLHEIRPGAAEASYGIAVAAIAGVPAGVLDRAKEILTDLEMTDLRDKELLRPGKAAAAEERDRQLFLFGGDAVSPAGQISPVSPAALAALDELRAVDADAMSPRDAHALLSRLKEILA